MQQKVNAKVRKKKNLVTDQHGHRGSPKFNLASIRLATKPCDKPNNYIRVPKAKFFHKNYVEMCKKNTRSLC